MESPTIKMSKRVATIYFNADNYPYDYQMDIWRDTSTGTFYVMDTTFSCYSGSCRCEADSGCGGYLKGVGSMTFGEIIPDQTWTVGQTCRWIHTGKADFNYDWPYTGYVGVQNSETDEHRDADKGFYKQFLGFTWEELEKEVHHLSFEIAFPVGHLD